MASPVIASVGALAVSGIKVGVDLATKDVRSPEQDADRKLHRGGCSCGNIFRGVWHRPRRVLFICMSYLDESSSSEKEWSIVISCAKRCPRALVQYRLQQEGDNVVCRMRNVGREKEMLVLISLENLLKLPRIQGGETSSQTHSQSGAGFLKSDFGLMLTESRQQPGKVPPCLERPTTLTGKLTWTWLWDVIAFGMKRKSFELENQHYTAQMISELVFPIANKFSEIVQRDGRDTYGAREDVRASPSLKALYLPAYRIGETHHEEKGRMKPRPPLRMTNELDGILEAIRLPPTPKGTKFGEEWKLLLGDFTGPELD